MNVVFFYEQKIMYLCRIYFQQIKKFMQLKNSTVLVLGGFGLVGHAICRKLMEHSPNKLIVTSLKQSEAEQAVEKLRKEFSSVVPSTFEAWWGDVFTRSEWKDITKNSLLSNENSRTQVVEDIFNELSSERLQNSALYQLIVEKKPNVVIDCINTATAIAYQDIYSSAAILQQEIASGDISKESVERMLSSDYIPQLIRHIQILYRGLMDASTTMYLKIGTSGTGGMGLNIPFTHSEEKPSRVLLAKASVAGAQSLLLFLMARTPEGPIIKEIKPSATIAWKEIGYKPIKRKGKEIELVDMPNPKKLQSTFSFNEMDGIVETGEKYTSVFIDTGENGVFSRAEFETISSLGLMEIITPEEIAQYTIAEILGGNTGYEIIQSLDASVLGPSYRGGILRNKALSNLRDLEAKTESSSIAFEMLGPPRLSKLLYEAFLLRTAYGNFSSVLETSNEEISKKLELLISSNSTIRKEMLSIGLVVLLSDGISYLRGKEIIVPPQKNTQELPINPANISKWCYDGWIDLRKENFNFWKNIFKKIKLQTEENLQEETGSFYQYDTAFWDNFETIDEGKIVAWIFENEDKGYRIKR